MAEVTIAEAAAQLGITKAAMRSRVHRHRIEAHKGADGQWYVILPDPASMADATPHPIADAIGATEGATSDAADEIAFLREQNSHLTHVIEAMQRDHARQISELHVLLQNTQRLIPAAVAETSHAPDQTTEDESPQRGTNVAPVTAHEAERIPEKSPRWPWWMRILGGK